MIELFKKAKDGIRYWSIDIEYATACLEIEYGWLNGILQSRIEDVEENASGRDVNEQLELRRDSRVKAKIDRGYRHSVEEANKDAGMNALGFYRPMLAKRFDQVRNINWDNIWCQDKYDGHRCLVRMTYDGPVAYSRQGKPITSINHIISKIMMPVGTTLDGELYLHGASLQKISSLVKRLQPETVNLEYVVYDLVSDEPYHDRYNIIKNINLGSGARLAPTDKGLRQEDVPSMLDTAIFSGYEGLILRDKDSKYEVGHRSKGLIKVKKFQDDEFLVVDVIPSSDGWGILLCTIKSGGKFRVSAPGTMENKMSIIRNKDQYIGKQVTIQYANLTPDGIPFHPVALRFREDI
tara:strand:- start:2864 stop:3916 length:1053 start_codon:yes stop_codon:yes gene_type:complete